MNRSALTDTKRRVRCYQGFARQAATIGVLENPQEPFGIVALANVEAKYLFFNVGIHVERTRANVGAFDHALEARPEVFNRVRVNATLNVSNHVVNERMSVFGLKPTVRTKRIGVEHRSCCYVLANVREQRSLLVVGDNHSANAATMFRRCALHHSEYRRFARRRSVRELR